MFLWLNDQIPTVTLQNQKNGGSEQQRMNNLVQMPMVLECDISRFIHFWPYTDSSDVFAGKVAKFDLCKWVF